MRRALLFVLLLLVPVPASAQFAEDTVRVLTDPAGDYYAALRDGPGITDPIPYYTFMDMEWLDVTESAEGFLFTIKVVDIEGPLDDTIGFSDGGFFWIHFTHNDWAYRLEIERPSGQLEIEYYAVLQSKYWEAEEWGFLWREDRAEWSISDATISVFLARDELPDGRGAAPYPGRALTEFWVVASQRSSRAEADVNGQTLQFPWQLQDRMPDTGIGDVSVPISYGLAQTGHAFLSSDEPYRASNGEATTFLYTVKARNDGDTADLFTLEAQGAPAAWDVDLPLAAVSLGPGEDLPLPVLVTTPFAHQHGGTASLVIEMRSTTDTSAVGRTELGVRYLEIPQPAGHHDRVFMHSIAAEQTASFNSIFAAAFQPSGSAYFNTLPDDPSSDEIAVTAFGGFGSADFTWVIPLDPTLRLGLDVDMDRLGQALFEITSPGPIQDATLEGAFVLLQAGSGFQAFEDAVPLGTFGETGIQFSPGGSVDFDLEVTPVADYVPYDPANELWLRIDLSGTGVAAFNANTVPAIESGAEFQLPLFDYEDDISDAFDALSGAQMEAATPATRDANPGDIILFDVVMTGSGGAAGDYTLSLIGDNTHWADIVTAADVDLSDAPQTATVLVEVPASATDGDRADLFLQAVHADPQRRGLIRLVVDVDTRAEHDDDRAAASQYLVDDEEASPGVGIISILGLLAVALRRR